MFPLLLGLLSLFSLVRSQCPGGIPEAEVQGFLDVHNKLRESISAGTYVAKGKKMPAAENPIANLTWNCDDEKIAQDSANSCDFGVTINLHAQGENLFHSTFAIRYRRLFISHAFYAGRSGSFDGLGRAASKAWESELQKERWSDIKMTEAQFKSIGHATHMAWAKSTKLGCGMAACPGGRVLVSCIYRDIGNFVGQNVYEPVSSHWSDVPRQLWNKVFGSQST